MSWSTQAVERVETANQTQPSDAPWFVDEDGVLQSGWVWVWVWVWVQYHIGKQQDR